MNIALLILYICSTLALGWIVVKKWFDGFPALLSLVAAFLLGTVISIPCTYVFATFFSKTTEPILWGVIVTIAVAVGVYIAYHARVPARRTLDIKLREIKPSDGILVLCSLLFSTWIMTKTFHGGPGGLLFVGSNNIFDFGFSIGLMRSMSWGANIPIREPFFAGLPLFYHYFFSFWIAIWEYLGAPTVWAMNIPSILSFTAFMIVIYYVPQIIGKQKPIVGWFAVFLTIANSSLGFWQLLTAKGLSVEVVKNIWRLQTYPFAGPFDGSVISIYMTLNNYVNQRHLALAAALMLFLFLTVTTDLMRKRLTMARSVLLGACTGFLFLWNTVIYVFAIAVMAILLVVSRRWRPLAVYLCVSLLTGSLFLLPIAGFLYRAYFFLGMLQKTPGGRPIPTWNIAQYMWQNLGLLPVVAGVGFFKLSKQARAYMAPFVLLFICLCVFAALGKRGFEQKSISFLIIGVNVLAAVLLGWLWQRKKYGGKLLAISLLTVLTISGCMDLMPIKNEFAFPLVGKDNAALISWIHASTLKDAVFVSYEDMIDPVVLAGRTNYSGFFKNVGQYDRAPDVKRIYAGDIDLAKAKGISFILVPKWRKNDFPYQVDLTVPIAYEDARYRVYRVE